MVTEKGVGDDIGSKYEKEVIKVIETSRKTNSGTLQMASLNCVYLSKISLLWTV
jgi:hypothetical protein